jgi:hypothetical protein
MKRDSLLATAIERQDWEIAALLLFLGVTRAARKLPPDSIEQIVEALSETSLERQRTRRTRGHR